MIVCVCMCVCAECHDIKEQDPGVSLEETINRIDEKREIICNYLNIFPYICNSLKHSSDGLTAFNLAKSYMKQNPVACWEEIVTILCSKLKDLRLARKVAAAHSVNFDRHCT